MEPAMSSSRHYHVVFTVLLNLPPKRFKILRNRPVSVVAGGHDVKFVQTAAKKEKVLVVEYK
jgi:hypothetical protein